MSLVKNYTYNLLYQIFNLILPIITMPYVSRILGKEGLGVNAYTNSIATYFVILGSLGIGTYATRQIACVRDNKKALNKNFTEILLLKMLMTSISLCIYIYIFIISNEKHRFIYILQSIHIISSMVDISWLYIGLENIKQVAIRSFIIKVIGLIGIFVFVKNSDDVDKYVFVLSISILIGQLIMWKGVHKYFQGVDLKELHFKNHLNSSIKYFIPQLAIQIYTVLDKTMLGVFVNTSEVGMYENAEKLVKMVTTLITTLSSVMIPRLSNIFSKGETDKVNNYVERVFSITTFFALPLTFGIMGVAEEFSPWFFGNDFDGIYILIQILSLIVVAITWQTVLGGQYLLSIGKIDQYSKIVFLGAGINFVLNLFLINRFKAFGVCVSTVIAEFIIALSMMYKVRNNLKISNLMRDFFKNLMASIVMFIFIRILGNILGPIAATTVIQVIIGSVIYFLVSIILKSENMLKGIEIVSLKISRRKIA